MLLLPPSKLKHVPTVHLGPRTHRDDPRVHPWGWGAAPPLTLGVDFLGLAEAAVAFARLGRGGGLEASVPGGAFGRASRFERLQRRPL